MKNHMWSTTLKIISEYDVIARWCWDIEGGFTYMVVPDKSEILEDRFVDAIDAFKRFNDLSVVEIDRVFNAGNFKQSHDIEAIRESIKAIAGLRVSINNDRLIIQSI